MPEQVGRRVYAIPNPHHACHPDDPDCGCVPVEVSPPMQPGDYCLVRYSKDSPGVWECYPPEGTLGSLRSHDIEVHEDGTITVSPSILERVGDGKGGWVEKWHGHLIAGVWKW